MGGLPVEHLSGVLARLMVRGKIDIMADSERVSLSRRYIR
jgi:hypothetical protein